MRWWVIGLLVANIAFFAWEHNRQLAERRSAPPTAQPIPEGVEPLKLVSELDQPPPLREEEAETGLDVSPEDVEPENPVSQNSTTVPPSSGPAPDSEPVMFPPAPQPKPAPAQVTAEAKPQSTAVQKRVNPPPAPAPVAPTQREVVCVLAGPFFSEGDAASAQRWFEGRYLQTRRHVEEKTDSKLFWVYIEPQSSHQEAREKVEDLKRKGLHDFFIIQGGEMRNAISLGVYRNQDSVNRRLAQLKGEGYQPLVVPRVTNKSTYWVDAWGKQDRKSFLAEARKRLSKKVVESHTCGEIAARSGNP
jgi:hypothetical protein